MLSDLSGRFTALRNAFTAGNIDALRLFAADSANSALEFNDTKFVKLSIVSYSLAKLMDKPYIVNSNRWKKFSVNLVQQLTVGETCKSDEVVCVDVLSQVVASVETLSDDLGGYVMSVVEKAKVKAATQIYVHGASVGRAIELTGADRKEFLSYLGGTRLPEKYETKTVAQRFSFTDKLFS